MPRIATQSMNACDLVEFPGLRPTAAGCRTLHTLLLPPTHDRTRAPRPSFRTAASTSRVGAREARRWIAPSPESEHTHFDSYPFTAQMGASGPCSNLRAGISFRGKIAFRHRKLDAPLLTKNLSARARTMCCANSSILSSALLDQMPVAIMSMKSLLSRRIFFAERLSNKEVS